MTAKFIVLIPCAGLSSRFGGQTSKIYTNVAKKTLIEHTLMAFLAIEQISSIVLVASPNDFYIDSYKSLSDKISIKKVGGQTRAETVLNGLNILECNSDDWILVHDAARCCIKIDLINKLINELSLTEIGGILAIKSIDTIKKVNNGIITETLDRQQIYLAQTPQMFRYKILKDSLSNKDLTKITDEASAVEQMGYAVKIVEGEAANIKVTYPVDLLFAEVLLSTL